MAYYVFKITQPTPIMKNLEYQESFEAYKDARRFTRGLRAEIPPGSGIDVRMVHAANQLQAEEMLMEKREKPVLMEWEK